MGQQSSRPDEDVRRWSSGPIPQAQAEETVKKGGTGSYLIRSVPERRDLHVLTVNDEGMALHYPITTVGKGFKFASRDYPSMGQLVTELAQRGVPGKSRAVQLTSSMGHALDASPPPTVSAKATMMAMVCPGYVGLMGKQEATRMVVPALQGSFLVRQSRKPSVYYLMVNDRGTVQQYTIVKDARGYRFGPMPFPTLDAVIKQAATSGLRGTRGKLLLTKPLELKKKVSLMERINANVPAVRGRGSQSEEPASMSPPPPPSNQAVSRPSPHPAAVQGKHDRQPGATVDHLDAPWYRGQLAKEEADRYVMQAGHGDYLVYQSSADGSSFALAVRDGGRVARFRIGVEKGKFVFGPRSFESLARLIQLATTRPLRGQQGELHLASPIVGRSSGRQATRRHSDSRHGAEPPLPDRNYRTPAKPAEATAETVPADDREDAVDMLELIAPMDEEAFSKLSRKVTKPEELPPHARGRRLNRFYDILPNPMTRVRLETLPIDPTLEYINASYVRGYGGRTGREYICAQAPLSTGTYNFVRMIYEKKMVACIMCTGLVERGKRKCARYWPEECGQDASNDLTFADLHVRKRHESVEDGFLRSIIEIRKDGVPGCHTFMHYWYNTWPDHGVPLNEKGEMDTTRVLGMLKAVKEYRIVTDKAASPLLVHCSAGVGRTGTLVVIDYCTEALKMGEPVDVTQVVSELREDRMALIQRVSQYRFAYQGVVQFAHQHRQAADAKAAAPPIYAIASSQDIIKRHTLSRDWQLHSSTDGVSVFELLPGAGLKQDEASGMGGEETLGETEEELLDDTGIPGLRIAEGTPAPAPAPAEACGGSPSPPRKTGSAQASPSKGPRQMKEEPWFKSNFTRAQVDEALGDSPVGSFLVRPSSKPMHFALSIRQDQRIANLLIVPVDEGGDILYKLGNSGKLLYPSVPQLIDGCLKEGIGTAGGPVVRLRTFTAPEADEEC